MRSYTLRSYTYIDLFVGNREVLGEFLLLTLNLLVGSTPSVEIKPFWKFKTEVVRITYVVQSLSLWKTTEGNVANDHWLLIPTTSLEVVWLAPWKLPVTVFVLYHDVILWVFRHVVTSILRALSLMTIPEENSLLLDFKNRTITRLLEGILFICGPSGIICARAERGCKWCYEGHK